VKDSDFGGLYKPLRRVPRAGDILLQDFPRWASGELGIYMVTSEPAYHTTKSPYLPPGTLIWHIDLWNLVDYGFTWWEPQGLEDGKLTSESVQGWYLATYDKV